MKTSLPQAPTRKQALTWLADNTPMTDRQARSRMDLCYMHGLNPTESLDMILWATRSGVFLGDALTILKPRREPFRDILGQS
jgi:hypothetical protein